MSIRKMMIRTRKFSNDQGGMEALQTVCIVAIAATILIAAATFGGKGTTMMETNFKELEKGIGAIAVDSGAAADTASDSKGGLASIFGKN